MRLDEYVIARYKNRNNDRHKPKKGIYHASSLYEIYRGKLNADNFFEEKEFDDSVYNYFILGEMYHDFVQKFFDNIEKKITISHDGWKIVGSVDIVYEGYPIELKTCSNFPNRPHQSHLYQLTAYTAGLEKEHGYITYILRHDKKFLTKTFKVDFREDLYEKIINSVDNLNTQLNENTSN